MKAITAILLELDRRLKWDGPKATLRFIGSVALMLQTGYERGTKDGDILRTRDVDSSLEKEILEVAGKGSSMHRQYRMYIDLVAEPVPFLPRVPRYRQVTEFGGQLRKFDVLALDVTDVVVSKLKRFSVNDVKDISAMVALGRVPHERLLERFKSAVDAWWMDARAEDLPACVRNLNEVERRLFDKPASRIELPGE